MKCPFCRQTDTDVYNSRSTKAGNQIWRRRRCLRCKQTFTTYESPDLSHLRIGSATKPAHYSRAKLFSSIYAAFTETNAPAETIDAVTATIEIKLLDLKEGLIERSQIADICLTTLKHFNTAAFIRYLSAHTHLDSQRQLQKQLRKY